MTDVTPYFKPKPIRPLADLLELGHQYAALQKAWWDGNVADAGLHPLGHTMRHYEKLIAGHAATAARIYVDRTGVSP